MILRQKQAAQIGAIRRTTNPEKTALALLMVTEALDGLSSEQSTQIIAAAVRDSSIDADACEALSNTIGRHSHELARNERTTA